MGDRTGEVVPPQQAADRDAYHYAPGVVVETGRLLFVAGQTGRTAQGRAIADPREQLVAAFEGLGQVLAAAGAGFADVVDLTTYHVGFDEMRLFVELKEQYFTGPTYPAWTAIGVAQLAMPGLLAEIKCTAAV